MKDKSSFFFLARIFILALAVSILPEASYAQGTPQEWQAIAVKKYPALGVSGSTLNTHFVQAFNARKTADPAFFHNPKWPLLLADELVAQLQPTPAAAPSPTPAVVTEQPPAPPAKPEVKQGEPQTGEYEADSIPKSAGLDAAKFRWWAPADTQVRGVLVLAPGRGGDGRGMAGSAKWQALATELQFGILACFFQNPSGEPFTYQNDPDGVISQLIDKTITNVLTQNKQEIKKPPLAFWGHSAGGNVIRNYMSYNPERVLAAVLMRATSGPGGLTPGKEDVPALVFVGKNDKAEWVKEAVNNYEQGRGKHALWTLALHPKEGHEVGNTDNLSVAFISAAAKLRLETKMGSTEGKLKKLTEQTGWLGDLETLDVAQFSQFKGKKGDATWFLNEAIAKAWQEYLKN